MRFAHFILTSVFVLTLTITCQAGATPPSGATVIKAYGMVDYRDPEQNRLVIDDTAMKFDAGTPLIDGSGANIKDLAELMPGTPVAYEFYIDRQVTYLKQLRVVDKLPAVSPLDADERRP